MKKILIPSLLFILLISSCVPARKYEDLKSKSEQCEAELEKLKTENEKYKVESTELTQQLKTSQREVIETQTELTDIKRRFKDKEEQYDKLENLYDAVLKRYDRLLASTDNENSMLSTSLEQLKIDLQLKEEKLNALQKELDEKQRALESREKRVKELEELIAQKDAAVNALKDKIQKALLAYKDKGLTVEQKNGKVYVSLDAKLLFPSGSTVVDAKGKQAVIDLAKALEGEKELEIIVEGHTDTDALKSTAHPKSNWELSVLRATAVVEIMTSNSSVDPKILSAAGRSEFLPVSADKAKNRRIEVILTPNLNKLFEIISNE